MSAIQPALPTLDDSFDQVAPADPQETEEDVSVKESDLAGAVLFNTDWTTETLVNQLSKGNINLNPSFQRRNAWDGGRKSRLIESLISGLPVPNIVLAESKESKGKYLVIDGKQRLVSIHEFFSDAFRLEKLSIRTDLNGLNKSDLAKTFPDDMTALENQTLRTVVIRSWPSEDFLFLVFHRLNSGSLPLSPQELRRALHAGHLLDFIENSLTDQGALQEVFGPKPDRRMRDSELVLRYIAFETKYPDYDGNLKEFLDQTVRYYDSEWKSRQENVTALIARFGIGAKRTLSIFGKDGLYRKWSGDRYEGRMNRAVFDCMMRYFPDVAEGLLIARRDDIVGQFKKLCVEDRAFRSSIETTTKSKDATAYRLRAWGLALERLVERKFDEKSFRLL